MNNKNIKRKIIVTANSSFMIANFRKNLVSSLLAEGNQIYTLTPSGSHVKTLKSWGCETKCIKMSRKGTFIVAEMISILRMLSALYRIKPDLVLSYTMKNNIYAGICCRLLSIPFIPNVSGIGPSFEKNKIFKNLIIILLKLSFKKCSTIFFQNSSDYNLFIENKIITAQQGKILPGSGVDLSDFTFEPLPAGEVITFLFAARLIKNKGILEFLNAAKNIFELGYNARFIVAGGIDAGNENSLSEAELAIFSDLDYVEFLGNVSDIRLAIREADCVVLPTYYNEGTPKILLEGLAMGRVLITTKRAGCVDTVIEGENGFFVKEKDTNGLVSAIIKVISLGPRSLKSMGTVSRRLAEDSFDVKMVVDQYNNAISELST